MPVPSRRLRGMDPCGRIDVFNGVRTMREVNERLDEPKPAIQASWMLLGVLAAVALISVAACSNRPPRSTDTIWDSPILDRRIEETPRQRTLRQCQQESERFRIECTYCHTTDKAPEISEKDLKLSKMGLRAQVMRKSVTFGLHTHCTVCHTTKFGLTSYAQKMFGPDGEKYRALEEEMNQTTIK